MIWVEDTRYIDGYRAFVKFNDGRESIIDIAPERLYELAN